MIRVKHHGKFEKTTRFLNKAQRLGFKNILERYGKQGVIALSLATPQDTGRTAQSWDYAIAVSRGEYQIVWTNSNESDGVSVAILIQYGHGSQNGSYVPGRDFINPAIRPILDKIAKEIWEEVIRL